METKALTKRFHKKYKLQLRMGMHTGRVIAGVIGQKKQSYDIWGVTVNTASRYESHGEAGKVHISEKVKNILAGQFGIQSNGFLEIKGLGIQKSYFLESPIHLKKTRICPKKLILAKT